MEDFICLMMFVDILIKLLYGTLVIKRVTIPRPIVNFISHGPFMHSYGFGFNSMTNDYKLVRVVIWKVRILALMWFSHWLRLTYWEVSAGKWLQIIGARKWLPIILNTLLQSAHHMLLWMALATGLKILQGRRMACIMRLCHLL